jgi:hypothetical protein
MDSRQKKMEKRAIRILVWNKLKDGRIFDWRTADYWNGEPGLEDGRILGWTTGEY